VGDRLAAVCRPIAFAKGSLRVEILGRDWESTLRSMERELLQKLRTATDGEVIRITFL
jgi:hypothetical protein